ncbi:hypothetical protein [Runella slithyformis]|uniref:Late embryogenesis abundant protein LEA-2 subgroup domain-containing protein n=1 Tax=Runella slithyformis (strain ATCC 29530 / DSM 19594 / LMG 11500 / NCIMB 11436 / LSU 4) TaxID=761193 RepID=A0A7U4E4F3_RUNSL|nr:hypothetical protein [Runella slithyformis]AEI47009.1 hypothetical protein Runsl_0566 [Runella slithyformis DSM 19594]
MRKRSLFAAFVLAVVVFNRCAVTRQISEAKTLADCKYTIASADKITLAGIDIQQFKNMQNFDLSKSPRLALALLSQDVPLNVRLNLDVTNPTKQLAGINQFEYKVLLAENEIFTGLWDQRIDVQPNGGTTRVPMQLTTNAYRLITDAQTRDSFVAMIENLSGKQNTQPTKLVIKLKPTLGIGNSQVNYPGYITIEKEVTAKMLSGE